MKIPIFRKWMFWRMYLKTPPWDTGMTPPELQEFAQEHTPGRAIDLGCGTGTNAIFLNQAGWEVRAVDFLPTAIRKAKRKAQLAGSEIDFVIGDVSSSHSFSGLYDLVLDMGCFHVLTSEQRQDYIACVGEHLTKGGTFLLYAFLKQEKSGAIGLSTQDVNQLQEQFRLDKRTDGQEANGRLSAWFWLSHCA